ncbi:hypothetical protein ACSBR2_020207 [Camellia fascicularis]
MDDLRASSASRWVAVADCVATVAMDDGRTPPASRIVMIDVVNSTRSSLGQVQGRIEHQNIVSSRMPNPNCNEPKKECQVVESTMSRLTNEALVFETIILTFLSSLMVMFDLISM